jgi:hypothetical protein
MDQLTLNIEVPRTSKPKQTIKRHDLDRYDSPGWFVTHLPNYLNIKGVIGEPCKGAGNLSSLLSCFDGCTTLWTNDIDTSLSTNFYLDAADPVSWLQFPKTDWVVTNPPFDQAFDILQNAYIYARVGVVMFLRLSFIEPTAERGQWLFNYPRYVDLVYPRFKFRRDKNNKSWQADSVPIAAMVWRKDTNQRLGSMTIPSSHILGFHDNPENGPSINQQIKNLRQIQNNSQITNW